MHSLFVPWFSPTIGGQTVIPTHDEYRHCATLRPQAVALCGVYCWQFDFDKTRRHVNVARSRIVPSRSCSPPCCSAPFSVAITLQNARPGEHTKDNVRTAGSRSEVVRMRRGTEAGLAATAVE